MFMTVSVIGGDLRQITVAHELKKEGYHIFLYGFDKDINLPELEKEEDVDYALGSDIIILPVPVTFDGIHINSPYSENPLLIEEFLDGITPSAIVFGGQIKPNFAKALEEKGIKFFDYLSREELAIRNAIPTAEGAIKIAIEETPITINGSKCLVLGYGRIGKILAKMLAGLGADVTVEARKYADLAMIDFHGYGALSISDLKSKIKDYDIIFNTVPALLIDYDALSTMKKDSLIIDLSSRPGGVDFNIAKELGIKAIWALGLPGKIAPVTSGAIIKDTIMNIIKELEV